MITLLGTVGRMFELRRLRLLHELALRGTLAAVAEALSYSPSTISQQLAQLEKDAGVPLLIPDGRRVRLTEHGVALAAHASRALELEEQIRGELESLQPGIAPVRVAVLQTAAQAILPSALTLLAEREPGLRVEIAEVPPEEGLFELSARGFDLVIAEQYPGHTRRAPLGARARDSRQRPDPAGAPAGRRRRRPSRAAGATVGDGAGRDGSAAVGRAAVPRCRLRAGHPLRDRRPDRAGAPHRRRPSRGSPAGSRLGGSRSAGPAARSSRRSGPRDLHRRASIVDVSERRSAPSAGLCGTRSPRARPAAGRGSRADPPVGPTHTASGLSAGGGGVRGAGQTEVGRSSLRPSPSTSRVSRS